MITVIFFRPETSFSLELLDPGIGKVSCEPWNILNVVKHRQPFNYIIKEFKCWLKSL